MASSQRLAAALLTLAAGALWLVAAHPAAESLIRFTYANRFQAGEL
jgi:hypothetical protein